MGLDSDLADRLYDLGLNTVERLLACNSFQLLTRDDLAPDQAQMIIDLVKRCLKQGHSLEPGWRNLFDLESIFEHLATDS